MERMKGSNEDMQSDVVSVEDEGAEMLSMENDFNSNVPGLLDGQLTSDLHEPQPAKKKASPSSNSRIRWLETKLKDIDTTIELIASNRKRKMKCCRYRCGVAESKSRIEMLDQVSNDALEAGLDITSLPSYKELRDSVSELSTERKCEGDAQIYCHDCMGFYCNACHVDHNGTHDIASYSNEVSFRKGFVNFPGYQARAVIGENKGSMNYMDRCACDDPFPRKVSRNFLDTSYKIKTIEIQYCTNCDDLDCILDLHGYVASGYAWAISKRIVASIRDCEGTTVGGMENVINGTNKDIGRKVKQERLQDAINWDTQLNAHLEASSKIVLPSTFCKCCQVPNLDPCCIEIKPRELITDGTPIQR